MKQLNMPRPKKGAVATHEDDTQAMEIQTEPAETGALTSGDGIGEMTEGPEMQQDALTAAADEMEQDHHSEWSPDLVPDDWNSLADYQFDEHVIANDKRYRTLDRSTGEYPPDFPAKWEELPECPRAPFHMNRDELSKAAFGTDGLQPRATYFKHIPKSGYVDDDDSLSRQQAAVTLEKEAMKAKKKEMLTSMNEQINLLDDRSAVLARREMSSRTEEVRVQDFLDVDAMKVFTYRFGTRDLIDSRDATAKDLQGTLPLGAEPAEEPEASSRLIMTFSPTEHYNFGDIVICATGENASQKWRCVQGGIIPSPVSEFGNRYWSKVEESDVEGLLAPEDGDDESPEEVEE